MLVFIVWGDPLISCGKCIGCGSRKCRKSDVSSSERVCISTYLNITIFKNILLKKFYNLNCA